MVLVRAAIRSFLVSGRSTVALVVTTRTFLTVSETFLATFLSVLVGILAGVICCGLCNGAEDVFEADV